MFGYLTNFWGSNGTVLVTEEQAWSLHRFVCYTIHAHEFASFVEIVETANELEEVAKLSKTQLIQELCFEDEITVA